eukprot:GCRY01002050.1.p1 GENE.GCRY01002050.1~~GCRY01002050.1.p1  ORF type:complete len:654 (-),score=121.69 GCRY01002050.1:1670-3631(-)
MDKLSESNELQEFIPILSAALNRLAEFSNNHQDCEPSVFDAVVAPTISIQQYMERIVKYGPCSKECFLLAFIYIDRLITQNNSFCVTFQNIHRLLITSVMLAAKFLDDIFFNNDFYAKIGGVTCAEINQFEVAFLFMVDFNLSVEMCDYDRYRMELTRLSQHFSETPQIVLQDYVLPPPSALPLQSFEPSFMPAAASGPLAVLPPAYGPRFGDSSSGQANLLLPRPLPVVLTAPPVTPGSLVLMTTLPPPLPTSTPSPPTLIDGPPTFSASSLLCPPPPGGQVQIIQPSLGLPDSPRSQPYSNAMYHGQSASRKPLSPPRSPVLAVSLPAYSRHAMPTVMRPTVSLDGLNAIGRFSQPQQSQPVAMGHTQNAHPGNSAFSSLADNATGYGSHHHHSSVLLHREGVQSIPLPTVASFPAMAPLVPSYSNSSLPDPEIACGGQVPPPSPSLDLSQQTEYEHSSKWTDYNADVALPPSPSTSLPSSSQIEYPFPPCAPVDYGECANPRPQKEEAVFFPLPTYPCPSPPRHDHLTHPSSHRPAEHPSPIHGLSSTLPSPSVSFSASPALSSSCNDTFLVTSPPICQRLPLVPPSPAPAETPLFFLPCLTLCVSAVSCAPTVLVWVLLPVLAADPCCGGVGQAPCFSSFPLPLSNAHC